VWGSTHGALRDLDGLIANLECCVSARGERWPGKVYYFRAGPDWAVPALSGADTVCVSLANNHALDFGPVALRDTLAHLDRGGIATTGAGHNRADALEPAFATVGGLDVATLGLTDRRPDFAAGPDSPGTAVATLSVEDSRTRRLIRERLDRIERAGADLVVASLHWGPNWETVKARPYRRFARWLVDQGVDVVHGHSAHVIQGIEVYDGSPICYDCGDLVDDYIIKEGLHNDRTFLFELAIDDGIEAVRLVPVEIVNSTAELAGDRATAWLHDRMRSLCAPFGTTVREEAGSPALRVPVGSD
jgi:poly-gamma-glutamate synthesis protein (capsule biosynthesis protein)